MLDEIRARAQFAIRNDEEVGLSDEARLEASRAA